MLQILEQMPRWWTQWWPFAASGLVNCTLINTEEIEPEYGCSLLAYKLLYWRQFDFEYAMKILTHF